MRLDKFTIKSQELVQQAQALAVKHGNQQIEPEHLFAALHKWIAPIERRDAAQPLGITSATSVPDQPQAIAEELPISLPGFDIAAGLTRLMGNKRLYRKLLREPIKNKMNTIK